MKMNMHLPTIYLRVILFALSVFLSVVSDGTYGDQNPQFTPLQCNNTAICASSQPLTFLYSVLLVTSCATECYFKQYQSAPCVGFNYRATNNSCDIFVDNPTFFDKKAGCQYYQNTVKNSNYNCTTLPGLHLLGTLVTSSSRSNQVMGTALLNEQLFVTRLNVAQVSVYNTTSFSLLRQISFTGFGLYMTGMATSATNNYLYVSDYYNYQVHRIDLSVTSSASVVTWSVPDRPYGVSLTSSGNVLVAFYYESRVREYTPGGSLVRAVTFKDNTYRAMEVSNGLWAILSPNYLCTVITNGTVTKCFRPVAGTRMVVMDIDRNGYYIVADFTNSILLMVNPSLTEARRIQLPINPGLNTPNSVSFDQSRGRLYVGEYYGSFSRVLVFDGIW